MVKTPISKRLEQNIEFLKEKMAIEQNFDVILREMKFGGVDAALLLSTV